MITSRFFWLITAALIVGILVILPYNKRDVIISPSYKTSSMNDLHLKHRVDSKVKWELSSDRAIMPFGKKEIYLNSLALKINQTPEINLTSGSGVYEVEKENVKLNNSVELNIKDAKFTTDTVRWDSKREVIDTDDDVKFIGSNFMITGSGLSARVKQENVRIVKDVKAIFYR